MCKPNRSYYLFCLVDGNVSEYLQLHATDEVLAKAHSAVTHEGVRSEAERLLSTGLHHDSDRVRNAALRVQGLLCLLDKSELSRAVPIFSSILQSPESDMKVERLYLCCSDLANCLFYFCGNPLRTKATLVQVLFDLIMLYGMKEIADRVEDDLESIFLSLLEDEDEVLRTVTAEGFAKLLFNDALDDHSAVSFALHIPSPPNVCYLFGFLHLHRSFSRSLSRHLNPCLFLSGVSSTGHSVP